MQSTHSIKVFISYCHKDDKHKDNFIKHVKPLEDNGCIQFWHDGEIIPGEKFSSKIDDNLDNADIIVLLISADFLASDACQKEKDQALSKNKIILPIIIAPCGWHDYKELSKLLALPKDGKAVSTFDNEDEAWQNVYSGFKKIIEPLCKFKQISVSDTFLKFISDTEIFSKAHSKRDETTIDDIFVEPLLVKFDTTKNDNNRIQGIEHTSEELFSNKSIIIAGDGQSGKTTICKMLFRILRKKGFLPLYISDNDNHHEGLIHNKIKKVFEEEYTTDMLFDDIPKEKIVLMIDDFHTAHKKGKIVDDISSFTYKVLIVDDIYSFDFPESKNTNNYYSYKIQEFTPTLRSELIKKWIYIDENHNKNDQRDDNYKNLDDKMELVDAALGKTFSSGIMPSYPFFILSILVSYESEKSLSHEITSQGYCYQALIYISLRKQRVKDTDIDTYINFLSEISFYIFKNSKYELIQSDFDEFISEYRKKYNLNIKTDELLLNVSSAKIFYKNSCGNYTFYYEYIYYFFVAKYLAEHTDSHSKDIENIIANLHNDKNAYISIFIAHHTRNNNMLDEIVLNAMCLFDGYKAAELSKNELSFFDDQMNFIVGAALPPHSSKPEQERAKKLQHQEKEEISNRAEQAPDDILIKDFRKSIKTIEVMGQIVKNRTGSLEKSRIEEIIHEGMKVYLRMLSFFIGLIENEKQQKEIISYIADKIRMASEKKRQDMSSEDMEDMAKRIFWNMNFFAVLNMIYKAIHSLGSDKNRAIIIKICDEEHTPAFSLIKHGMLMWNCKNLQTDKIVAETNDKQYSRIAKRVMEYLIVEHCSLHHIDYKDKQKISEKLKINQAKMLMKT